MAKPVGPLQAIRWAGLLFAIQGAAHGGRSCSAAPIGSIAQKLLDSFSGIDLAGIDVPLAVQAYLVDPVKLACHPAAAPEAAELLQIASVQQVDGHVGVITDIEATLRRIFG